jgi:thiopurine S-methyltransferase
MDAQFWRDRWAEGKTAFHEGKPNELLETYAGRLGAPGRVLVPLCGKTVDLAYLAGLGHTVIGIELVEDAARQFFVGASPEITPRRGHVEYRAGAISILVGDFFAATPELIGAIDAVYDRAALIALPPELRPHYAAHVRVLAPGARDLLITPEYEQSRMGGPPFSVEEPEVRALFPEAELLETRPTNSARMKQEGIDAIERCYAIRLGPSVR